MKKRNSEVRSSNHSKSDTNDQSDKSEFSNRIIEKTKSNSRNRSKYLSEKTMTFDKLPSLSGMKKQDTEKIIKAKLKMCCIEFDFSTSDRVNEKEMKERTLIELSNFILHFNSPLQDYIYSDICHMVGCNIFRTLAPFHPILTVGIEEEEDFQLNESWPHLQFVYEIMLRLLEHSEFDVKKAKNYIDHTFVKYLLELFDSADPRERDLVKTVLHRIYGKMVSLRAFIRKHINNIFFTFIYETERHNGIAELLEILGSVINGFQVPLKEEHKEFLRHVLLPLHKARSLNHYHPQLAYCVTEFVKKDRSLIVHVIVDGLIKFWPKMHSYKELMFLNELEECLELCDNIQFLCTLRPLFMQLSRCVSSSNFQVCERTLFFWTNMEIINLMTPHIENILPLIFPALYNSKQHWNKQVHTMVFHALKVMMDMNQEIFDKYASQFKENRQKEKLRLANQTELWNKMFLKAKKNPLYKKYSSLVLSSSSLSIAKEDTSKDVIPKGEEMITVRRLTESDTITKKTAKSKSSSPITTKSIEASKPRSINSQEFIN